MSAVIKPSGQALFTRMKHQLKAVPAILKELRTHDRCSIKMACGTGKTLVGKWTRGDGAFQYTVVFVPTIALVDQLLSDWNTEGSVFNTFAVCSQSSVGEDLDSWMVDDLAMRIPVSTNPAEIRAYIEHAQARPEPLLVICTYDSAPVLAAGMPDDFWFDLGVFDEAHKMAGRDGGKYAFGLENRNIRLRKRLFMTATPKQWDYTHESNDEDIKPEAVCSMDNTKKFGRFVFEYSFGEAIRDKVICDYEIIVSVIDQTMIPGYKKGSDTVVIKGKQIALKDAANIIAMQQVMKKYALKKSFCFHSRIESSKRMVEAAEAMVKGIRCSHIDGSMPAAERTRILKEMEKAILYWVTNSRCLSEGVNVPNADLLALFDPMHSKEDIVQRLGRVIRKYKGKDKAYVVIPLFVDGNAGMPLHRLIGQFNNVVAVLGALKDEGGDLESMFRIGKKDAGETLTRGLSVQCEGDIVGLIENEIQSAMTQYCVRRLYPAWEGMFYAISEFKKRHGRFPTKADADSEDKVADLFLWSGSQRSLRNAGGLTRERIKKLDSIDFPWNGHDVQFFADLFAYQMFENNYGYKPGDDWAQEGHKDLFEVSEEKRLVKWLEKQRDKHMEDSLTKYRRRHLKAAGIDFGQDRESWTRDLASLCNYIRHNGADPCEAKRKSAKIKQRIAWKAAQNEQHKKGTLPKPRERLLQALGHLPSPEILSKKDRRIMDEQIAELELYVETFGMLPSPRAMSRAYAKLGEACLCFFRMAGAGTLEVSDRENLEVAGLFRTYPNNEMMLDTLEAYVTEHYRIPEKKPVNNDDIGPLLYDWMNNMVMAFNHKALPLDQHGRFISIMGCSFDGCGRRSISASRKRGR